MGSGCCPRSARHPGQWFQCRLSVTYFYTFLECSCCNRKHTAGPLTAGVQQVVEQGNMHPACKPTLAWLRPLLLQHHVHNQPMCIPREHNLRSTIRLYARKSVRASYPRRGGGGEMWEPLSRIMSRVHVKRTGAFGGRGACWGQVVGPL